MRYMYGMSAIDALAVNVNTSYSSICSDLMNSLNGDTTAASFQGQTPSISSSDECTLSAQFALDSHKVIVINRALMLPARKAVKCLGIMPT